MTKRKAHIQLAAQPEATHGDTPLHFAPGDLPLPPPSAPTPVEGTPQPRSPRAPTARRVSALVVKAETALLALERRRATSLEHHERSWAGKRAALILSFPADVRAALEAMNVLDGSALGATKTNGAEVPAKESSAGDIPPPVAARAGASAPADQPGEG